MEVGSSKFNVREKSRLRARVRWRKGKEEEGEFTVWVDSRFRGKSFCRTKETTPYLQGGGGD